MLHAKNIFLRGFVAVLCLTVSLVFAQDDQEEGTELGARQLSEAERSKFQDILKTPLDLSALKIDLERQIKEKLHAAMMLGNQRAESDLVELALKHVPTNGVINDVARIERDRHRYEKAVTLHRELVNKSAPIWKPFYMAHVANDYLAWWKNNEAEEWAGKAESAVIEAQGLRLNPLQERNFLRSQRFVLWVRSIVDQRKGRMQQAINAAVKAEAVARKAFQIELPKDTELDRLRLIEDVAHTLSRLVYVYRNANKLFEAEQALRNYLRFASEVKLTPVVQSGIFDAASSLKIAQRDYKQSKRLGEKSLDLYLQTGRQAYERGARDRMVKIAVSYAGLTQFDQAQQQIDRIDQTFKQSRTLDNAPYPFDRAYISLGLGRNADAATLFERVRKYNLPIYGETHYYTAQAAGMQGVALWRMGQHDTATSLLEQSVKDLVHPSNADYLESFAYRPEIRQTIISTYIAALSSKQSPQIVEALGLADWLKAGSTREALADAALRSAAQTQGLSDLVRQEQDVRNEIKGLRDYLSGEAGGARSTLPQVATQMRDRIFELEKLRVDLQGKIKTAFPEYEKLVRPLPPKLDEIANVLKADEALLLLMPEEKGVHVWAVMQKGGRAQGQHHWVDWSLSSLTKDVAELRRPLEALGETGQIKPFPDHLAHQLYQKLIEPLSADIKSRPQWIVAAAGPLAQLPFSLLREEPAKGDKPAKWLIDSVALTHIPSVGSWLNLRALSRRVKPDQSLMAWGDPLFKPMNQVAAGKVSGQMVRAVRSSTVLNGDLEKEILGAENIYHDIPPLPETREELLQLAKALKADPSDLNLGAQATRNSVLEANKSGTLKRKRVLVFATHGLMTGELPGLNQPALALAANGEEVRNPLSPLLTLEDVLGLKLNSDWVVLSACNTAAGDGKGEEALSGLARGFFYAGSRALLVTHWAVESESAKELTTRTFEHYFRKNDATKAESLRQAILQVKSDNRYRHPVFWAPYVLVGDSTR